MNIPILYEDNHLLVVQKPCNMPTQGDASGDLDLLSYCKQDLKKRYNKPGEAYLGLVHRLDRPVGGVVCLAKTSKAAKRLSDQLRTRQMHREYLAIVHGEPRQARATLENYLLKDSKKNQVRVVPSYAEWAKYASLGYELAAAKRKQGLSMLRVQLNTGRAHQIRVQLSAAGYPIWGDQKYGSDTSAVGQQIALWAHKLTLLHPTTKAQMKFVCPVPQSEPWPLFEMFTRD